MRSLLCVEVQFFEDEPLGELKMQTSHEGVRPTP